jgi:hypothetical protein
MAWSSKDRPNDDTKIAAGVNRAPKFQHAIMPRSLPFSMAPRHRTFRPQMFA